MLGVDPNVHAEEIPEGYMERNLEDLGVTTPPEGFVAPDWAGGPDGTGEEDHVPEVQEDQVHVAEDHVSERPSTSNREQAKRKRAGWLNKKTAPFILKLGSVRAVCVKCCTSSAHFWMFSMS